MKKTNYFLAAFIFFLLMFFTNFVANAQISNGSEICDSMSVLQENEDTYFLYCRPVYTKYEMTEQESLDPNYHAQISNEKVGAELKDFTDKYTKFFGGAAYKEVVVVCYNDVMCAAPGTELFVTPLNNVTGIYRIICDPENYKGEFIDFILVKVIDVEQLQQPNR